MEEDLGEWDDSSRLVPEMEAQAVVVAREDCIISGLAEAREIYDYFGLISEALYDEGEYVPANGQVLYVRGSARAILQSERLALNFMARMSGISTLTRQCVLSAGGLVRIAATRKTTPGFRLFEKRAVFLGGGDTHRFNLSDAVLIKDNHIQILGLEECLRRAKQLASFTKKIEVEVESLDDMLRAAQGGADIIMFDNMAPEEIARGAAASQEKGASRSRAPGGVRRNYAGQHQGLCRMRGGCALPWRTHQKREMDRFEPGDRAKLKSANVNIALPT